MIPVLKGLHLTIDSWQPPNWDEDGWRQTSGHFEPKTNDGVVKAVAALVLVHAVPWLVGQDLRALGELTDSAVAPRVQVFPTAMGWSRRWLLLCLSTLCLGLDKICVPWVSSQILPWLPAFKYPQPPWRPLGSSLVMHLAWALGSPFGSSGAQMLMYLLGSGMGRHLATPPNGMSSIIKSLQWNTV
jgi:hypothetical protein